MRRSARCSVGTLKAAVEAEAEVDRQMKQSAEKDRLELDAEVARLDQLLAECRSTAASDTQASKDEVSQALTDFKTESLEQAGTDGRSRRSASGFP